MCSSALAASTSNIHATPEAVNTGLHGRMAAASATSTPSLVRIQWAESRHTCEQIEQVSQTDDTIEVAPKICSGKGRC
jgi:hypothetical protein